MCSSNVDLSEKLDSSNPQIIENETPKNLNDSEINKLKNDTIPQEPRIQNLTKSFFKKMYIIVREFCFFMLLILTYASFQNNNPKVSKTPNAFPFFPPESIVKDWHRGQLTEAINLATESDLSFVMYYAPWDAESQAVRHEFNIVSQHMHKYIHFAAVNCWQPGSECRIQYNKVYSWPVLMAYPAHGRGIIYKGLRKAEHMIKFLQSVMKPFTRIVNHTELHMYRALYDAVIYAQVNANLGSYDYGVLYSTALRILERDPLREIQFLVITGNLTEDSYSVRYPHLLLFLWNETHEYPIQNGWQPDPLLTWIFDNIHQVSLWALPSGTKSQYLMSFLQPGPALLLFTPRNPLYDIVDYYSLLRELAIEYYDCDDRLIIKLQKINLIQMKGTEQDHYVQHKKLLEKCSINQNYKIKKDDPTVTYDLSRFLLNNTCSAISDDIDKNNIHDKCEKNVKFDSNKIYIRSNYFKEYNKYDDVDNKTEEKVTITSMFTGEGDERSPKNLQKILDEDKCRYLKIAHNLQPALFVHRKQNYDYKDWNTSITALACKTNMSLSIIAIDSLHNFYFAESLGIDILNKKDKTAVVILNPKFETHHIMTKPFSPTNLRNFIYDFSVGNLKRVLSSKSEINSTIEYKNEIPYTLKPQMTYVKELTTTTFLPTVLKQGEVVIIFYHSIKCAFCSGISHVYLAVARLLQSITNLKFTRIDGDDHTLPWEYSMHHYPTIIFFPAQRKSETRAFPDNMQVTITNLLSFILANVEPEMRLHIMWTLCKETKYEQDIQLCARTLRLESSSLVGKMLREYRSSTSSENHVTIFKKLQLMRLLQFLFTSSAKVRTATIQQYMSKLYLNDNVENIGTEKL